MRDEPARQPGVPGPHPEEDPADTGTAWTAGRGAGMPEPGQLGGHDRDDDADERAAAARETAGGGWGSASGASGGGSGDGEPGGTGSPPMDDGTTSGATGAAPEGPTTWLRRGPGGPEEG